MPRRLILTTATLAAFLTSEARMQAGERPAAAQTRPAGVRPFSVRQPRLLDLDGCLVAVDLPLGVQVRPGGEIPVSLQLDPIPRQPPLLWVGRKNAWGSLFCRAQAQPGLPGFFTAVVAAPRPLPAQSRLWLGIERPDGRLARAALPA